MPTDCNSMSFWHWSINHCILQFCEGLLFLHLSVFQSIKKVSLNHFKLLCLHLKSCDFSFLLFNLCIVFISLLRLLASIICRNFPSSIFLLGADNVLPVIVFLWFFIDELSFLHFIIVSNFSSFIYSLSFWHVNPVHLLLNVILIFFFHISVHYLLSLDSIVIFHSLPHYLECLYGKITDLNLLSLSSFRFWILLAFLRVSSIFLRALPSSFCNILILLWRSCTSPAILASYLIPLLFLSFLSEK